MREKDDDSQSLLKTFLFQFLRQVESKFRQNDRFPELRVIHSFQLVTVGRGPVSGFRFQVSGAWVLEVRGYLYHAYEM